jgi:hypothetical protein
LSARSISDCEVSSVRNSATPMEIVTRPSRSPLDRFSAVVVVGDGDRRAQGRVGQRDDKLLTAVTGGDLLHRDGARRSTWSPVRWVNLSMALCHKDARIMLYVLHQRQAK